MAWRLSDHPPHFTDFQYVLTEIAYGPASASSLGRAFFTAELLRPGDRLLDIGCGDGFATRRLYSEACAAIDAVDIEPDAIQLARSRNSADNIEYHLADAVATPFANPPYDVIVWDGAIGHFPADTTERMLAKIRDALTRSGVFTGSESLGRTEGGYDHLQFFETLDDLAALLRRVFQHVRVKESRYMLDDGTVRREGYWRCGLETGRLDGFSRVAGFRDPLNN